MSLLQPFLLKEPRPRAFFPLETLLLAHFKRLCSDASANESFLMSSRTNLPSWTSPNGCWRPEARPISPVPGRRVTDHNLWLQHKWRCPAPEERASIHGLPITLFGTILDGQPGDKGVELANTLIGNGFHIPSMVVILTGLFNDTQPKYYTPKGPREPLE